MSNELVLIVEDNERNLKLVHDILEFKGYRTLSATTGAEGIELAGRHQPELILMDIQLPDTDGLKVLSQLKRDTRTASLKIVALTAFAMTEDAERFHRAGFDGYLTKPINVKEFPDQIRQYLEQDSRKP